MKYLSLILLTFTLCSFGLRPESQEQVVIDRIEYIYNLKSFIDIEIWKGFADSKFDLPFIYYTGTSCYITNPTSKFIHLFKPNEISEKKDLKVYKTPLIDSIPFHVSTGIILGDSSTDYNYRFPFMHASSFEITRNTIQDVNSTELWATMIIHEYFHGFQYKHPAYLEYFEKNVVSIREDSLKKIYKSNSWFKEGIDKENDILISAVHSTDYNEIKLLINTFFLQRERRRLLTTQKLHFDIKTTEEAYETMEGTARYVEYNLYRSFVVLHPDDKLAKSDSSYHSGDSFKNYKIEKDKWLYLTSKTSYFYATGFNLARLLDKLKIEYKSRLFNEPGLSLEQILKSY